MLNIVPQISDHQQSWGYEDGPWKGPGPPLLVAADLLNFFYLCFIGSVGFDDKLTDSSMASILFAAASFSGGCAAGANQQIVKNMQKKFYPAPKAQVFRVVYFGWYVQLPQGNKDVNKKL